MTTYRNYQKKKKSKKVNYTVLMIPDRPECSIRQSRTSGAKEKAGKVWLILWIVITVLLLAGAAYVVYLREQYVAQLTEQIAELESQAEQNEATIQELNDKVSVLSETLTQQTAAAEAAAEQEAEKYLPTGLPVDGTAGYREDFDASTSAQILIFEAGEGVDILATGAGVVSYVGSDDTYLNVVMVDHGNGYVSVYRNHSTPKVKEGTEVLRGSIIYEMDEESTVLGYQIKKDGSYIDPNEMMQVYG